MEEKEKKLQHKVIITENENDVNEYLTNGWLVKEFHLANCSKPLLDSFGNLRTDGFVINYCKFCFILEKNI